MAIIDEAFKGKPEPCHVIDAHTHLCPYVMNGWHQLDEQTSHEKVVSFIKNLGIDRIVTSPHPMIIGHMQEANLIAGRAADAFPGIVYGYITVVPLCGLEEVRAELNRYAGNPRFVGLKFLSGYHGELLRKECLDRKSVV